MESRQNGVWLHGSQMRGVAPGLMGVVQTWTSGGKAHEESGQTACEWRLELHRIELYGGNSHILVQQFPNANAICCPGKASIRWGR